MAAGQRCPLGDKCQYLHAIQGWRIEADAGADAVTDEAAPEGASSDSEVALPSPPRAEAEQRRCSACNIAVAEWAEHVRTAEHKERLFGRVKTVLERGLEFKDTTHALVVEAFGSWKAMALERPDLFYVEQGAIRLRKVAGGPAKKGRARK